MAARGVRRDARGRASGDRALSDASGSVPRNENAASLEARGVSSRIGRTHWSCHARRHWNSPSYRTAAGNISIRWRACCKRKDYANKISSQNGAEGDRTPDLCSAIAALSQLSYSPASMAHGERGSAPSIGQTETAPQPCGAAVTVRNLAGRPALSSRRVTRARSRAITRCVTQLRTTVDERLAPMRASDSSCVTPTDHDSSRRSRRPRRRTPAARSDTAHAVQLLGAALGARGRRDLPEVGEPAAHRLVQAARRVQRAADDAERGAPARRGGVVGGESWSRHRARRAYARHARPRLHPRHRAGREARRHPGDGRRGGRRARRLRRGARGGAGVRGARADETS